MEHGSTQLPTLLVIDDEPLLAAYVAKVADLCAYSPLIAQGDDDFRHQFRTMRPALVVLDLGMPNSDGVQLLRFLAEEAFKGPVIIISGFDRRVLDSAFRLGEALGLNMAESLEKPAPLEILEEVLNRLKPTLS